jgi:asparagine synthase (glutamine-hydrolysing)
MCGIQFVSNSKISRERFNRSLNLIKHRGPDDFGIENPKKHVFLGSRRLAIQDLSKNGHMPMQDKTKRYSIVFNGEVYNFKEIKKDLSEFTFISGGDTEVVLYSYIKWGSGCLKRFNGMFAFVIYDVKTNKVFFARDRFGQKPCLYSYKGKNLVVGSEAKQFIALDKSLSQIDQSQISNLLSFRYIPQSQTGFKHIKMLKPGNFVELVLGSSIKETPYWSYKDIKIDNSISYIESISRAESLLESAVKKRLISDVPVGVYLSGGLDSSLVTALASKHYAKKLNTFSIGYTKDDKETELEYARQIAKKFKTNHTEIKIDFSKVNIEEYIDSLFNVLDRPIADPAIFPSYLISKYVGGKTKVVLNGDGGDELFTGYKKNTDLEQIAKYHQLPKSTRIALHKLSFIGSKRAQFLLEGLNDGFEKTFLYKVGCFHSEISNGYYIDKKSILNSDYFSNSYAEAERILGKSSSVLRQIENYDVTSYMPDDTLPKVDFATMAFGIEARSPFLDHNLAEYAFSIPYKHRLKNNENKHITKTIAKKYLSSDLIYRKKQGFSVPLQKWFSGDLYSYLNDTLLSKNAFIGTYTKRSIVKKLIQDNKKGVDYSNHLWVLLTLEKWCTKWVK